MSDQAQEGVFLLVLAVALAVLWLRGYLTGWIGALTAAVTTPPVKQPFAFPSTSGGRGRTPKAV
jgi:hypothetical protein